LGFVETALELDGVVLQFVAADRVGIHRLAPDPHGADEGDADGVYLLAEAGTKGSGLRYGDNGVGTPAATLSFGERGNS